MRIVRAAATNVDLGGGILAPGFIDVQVNGGGGALMNDRPERRTSSAASPQSHRKYGTVGMMPTLVTDAPEKMPRAIAAMREARRRVPSVLGIHLEGPFLDPARKGAHEARYIRPIEPSDIEMIASADCGAVMLTLAPNRVPADAIRALAARGVLVSLGHSEATYEEAQRRARRGRARVHPSLQRDEPVPGREPGHGRRGARSERSLRRNHRRRASRPSREPCGSPSPPSRTTGSC